MINFLAERGVAKRVESVIRPGRCCDPANRSVDRPWPVTPWGGGATLAPNPYLGTLQNLGARKSWGYYQKAPASPSAGAKASKNACAAGDR